MHSADPNRHSADSLRRENEELRRELDALRSGGTLVATAPALRGAWNPSKTAIIALSLFILTLLVVAFLGGYLPLQHRRSVVIAESQHEEEALPRVQVVQVAREGGDRGLEVPGSIQAINEAPVLARTDGYLKTRFVDLGDHVKSGQPLAELQAPEMDDQLRAARATLDQARAALDQAGANLDQGKSDLEFSRVSAERWSQMAQAGIVAKQDDDKYRLDFQSKTANVHALEKALNVQKSNIAAAEANVTRLENLKSYLIVKAPFDGVITLRNVDAGALVSAGNTMLFRIAQTDKVRTYVSVPQTWVSSIRAGQAATIRVAGLQGREFTGTVARTANALDPTSRTLLAEVTVVNRDGALLPGMAAQVELSAPRQNAPLVVPADALVIRSNGSQVAVVRPDATVHLQKIEVGRDYGDRLEVVNGLREGETVVQNPGDVVREGMKVDPVPAAARPDR
jgi:RND family efflux transporter MFP subunit